MTWENNYKYNSYIPAKDNIKYIAEDICNICFFSSTPYKLSYCCVKSNDKRSLTFIKLIFLSQRYIKYQTNEGSIKISTASIATLNCAEWIHIDNIKQSQGSI